MKLRLSILLLLLCPLSSLAEGTGDIVSAICTASAQVNSLECSFVQTRVLKMRQGSMVAEGTLSFARPESLKWEYTSPYKYSFTLDNASNSMEKQIARMIADSITGKLFSNGRAFEVSAAEEGSEWIMTLIPVRKDMKQLLSRLTVHYSPSLGYVTLIRMEEASGDSTTIEFSSVKMN